MITEREAQVIGWWLSDLKDGELQLSVYDRGAAESLERKGFCVLRWGGDSVGWVDEGRCRRALAAHRASLGTM